MLGQSVAGQAMDNARMNDMSSADQADLQEKANAKADASSATLFSLMRGGPKDGALKLHAVDWEKMKQGFLDLERLYPNSLWNKNAFCFYAFCANDRETTTRLVAELRDRFAAGVWPSERYSSEVKEWTRTGTVPSRQIAHCGEALLPRTSAFLILPFRETDRAALRLAPIRERLSV